LTLGVVTGDSSPVRIALLGPLAVDDREDGLRRRERVVLSALAVSPGRAVSAERLADALWGSRPPTTWSKVVQGCIARLRKALGANAIETTSQGYRLVVPVEEIDARRFERMLGRARELLALGEPERARHVVTEALSLWRGEPFADLEGWDAGGLEAGRLLELRLDAEEVRLEATLRSGRYQEVLDEAQARTTAAPLRERRWALLSLALYQAGRQAEALRTLQRARTVLVTELGLDLSPDLAALEQAILRQDPALVAGVALPDPSPVCPYLGLVPYGIADAEAFFGREADVAACLRRLSSSGVLVVVGPSGSGKSSLVLAGVAAALERAGRRTVVITPGSRPSHALNALSQSGTAPVLVVDQCEEAFTRCEDTGEREALFASLTVHADVAPLVVALRADYLGEVSAYPAFARLVERGLYLLGAMRDNELRAAIEGPATFTGLLLEPGLVDLLVREVEGEPGALPLLSHALRMTWEVREGRTLTVSAYRETGGIRSAVAQSAEELYERVLPDRRNQLRDLLLRLVSPTPEGEPVRTRVPRQLIANDPVHEELMEMLVGARLVTSDDSGVELAHEALARAWPRLKGWLDDDVEGQRVLRHLSLAAGTWESMDRPDSELYRGVRLAQVSEWRDANEPELTEPEQAFLAASTRLAEAEQRADQQRQQHAVSLRMRTRQLLGAAVVLALVTVLAVYGFVKRNEADRLAEQLSATAEPRRLAAESILLVDDDPDLAMLLALQSLDSSARASIAALSQAEEAVHWAIQEARVVYPVSDAPVDVRLGPDGPTGIYRLPIPDLVTLARNHLGDRRLTADECSRFEIANCPGDSEVWPSLPDAAVASTVVRDGNRPLAGTTVSIVAPEDDDGLLEDFEHFEARTGIEVQIRPAEALDAQISSSSGDPTDLGLWPKPGLDAAAADHELIDLGVYLAPAAARRQVGDYLVQLGAHGSKLFGVPTALRTKGLVWYPVPEFAAAGYTVPRSWDELVQLTERIVADGQTPWCLGLESDQDFDGWPGTDWIEALVLRLGGVEVYDQWLAHEIGFEHPIVREAFTRFGQLMFAGGVVRGGVDAVGRLNWRDAVHPLLNDPPGCWLVLGASYQQAVLPDGSRVGTDIGSFVLPPIKPGGVTPLSGELQMAGALRDRPEVREFVRWLVSPDWGANQASDPAGSSMFPNLAFDVQHCRAAELSERANAERIRMCQQLQDSLRSDLWRLDASDFMPPEVGGVLPGPGVRGVFLQAMLDYVAQGEARLDHLLATIDAAWPVQDAAPA
jgi:DNA-binding SARP family transcriptional activator/ABC-type glycerol-3-phosphate transport system substrate-binding protein